MAKILDIDPAEWEQWVSARPPAVQKMCRRFPADRLYRLKSSGHRVTISSYAEDGTVTVAVSGLYNAVIFERCVFGIDPDSLEECDLPDPNEQLGALLTDDADIERMIQMMREEKEQ